MLVPPDQSSRFPELGTMFASARSIGEELSKVVPLHARAVDTSHKAGKGGVKKMWRLLYLSLLARQTFTPASQLLFETSSSNHGRTKSDCRDAH